MCGRYRLSRRKQLIEEYFGSVSGDDDWNPRYNIAPTQPVPVIRQNPKEPTECAAWLKYRMIDPQTSARQPWDVRCFNPFG